TGAMVGLCAATKYNGALLALPAATAWAVGMFRMRNAEFGMRNEDEPGDIPHSAFRIPKWVGWGVAMATAAIVVFLGLNPYMLLDWKEWAAGFGVQYEAYKPATELSAMWTSLNAQVGELMQTDPGIVYAGVAGVGLLLATIARMWDDSGRKTNDERRLTN